MGATVVLVALAGATGAAASDSGQIRADLKDGRLDGSYSQRQLSEYLNSAMTQGYGNPVATPVPPAGGVAGVQTPTATPSKSGTGNAAGVAGAQSPALAEVGRTGTLPFTGIDLALLTFGGFLMLALGLGARRLGRTH